MNLFKLDGRKNEFLIFSLTFLFIFLRLFTFPPVLEGELFERFVYIKEIREGHLGHLHIIEPRYRPSILFILISVFFDYLFLSPVLSYFFTVSIFYFFLFITCFYFFKKYFNFKTALLSLMFLLLTFYLLPTGVFLPSLLLQIIALCLFYDKFIENNPTGVHSSFLGILMGLALFFSWCSWILSLTISFYILFLTNVCKKRRIILVSIFVIFLLSFWLPLELSLKWSFDLNNLFWEIRRVNNYKSFLQFNFNFPKRIKNLVFFQTDGNDSNYYLQFIFFRHLLYPTLVALFFIPPIWKKITKKIDSKKILPLLLWLGFSIIIPSIIFIHLVPVSILIDFIFPMLGSVLLSNLLSERTFFIFSLLLSIFLLTPILKIRNYLPYYPLDYSKVGYVIASHYQSGNLESFVNTCEKLGENKYYCFKAFGNILLIDKFISNRTLGQAIKYCKRLPYEEWCLKGLSEEVGYHVLPNLTLYHLALLHRKGGKLIEEWKTLTSQIDVCEVVDEKYKHSCYKGMGKILSAYGMKVGYPINETVNICRRVNNTFLSACLEGIFSFLSYTYPPSNPFPFIHLSECEKLKKFKDLCYESKGTEAAFLYSETGRFDKFCKYFDKNTPYKEFKKFCYLGMGRMLGEKFRYNLTKAYEYCMKSEEPGYCEEGLQKWILLNEKSLNEEIFLSRII